MAYWQLFIDESGDFGDAEDEGTVAGLLARAYDTADARGRLRARLGEVYPRTTWPPHAMTLNIPASRVAFDLHGAAPEHPEVSAACGPARAALERAAGGAADLARRAAGSLGGWEPPDRATHEAIREADRWLQQNARAAWGALRLLADRQEQAMVACGGDLGALLGGAETYAVAAWGRLSDDDLRRADALGLDGYLLRLSTLLERVRALLALREGEARQVVFAHVARRDVLRPRRGPMTLGHLSRAARATAGPPGARAVAEFVFHPPRAYDGDVHPGVAVADFVANRLQQRIFAAARSARPWAEIPPRVRDATGLPAEHPRAGAPLPTCAADGAFREAVVMGWEGRAAPADIAAALAGELPRWAAEQATRWVTP